MLITKISDPLFTNYAGIIGEGLSLSSGRWVEFYESSVDVVKDIKNGSKLLIGRMY